MSDDRLMAPIPRKVPGVENRPRRRRDGTVYWTFRVRWTDPATGQRTSEEFDEQADAKDFQAKLRLSRRSGALGDLNVGRETLASYAEEWWLTYASRNLARPTLKRYSEVWNGHALPRLGALQLRSITPGVIARFRSDLEDAGVGAPTIRKTMTVIQSMLRRAVEEDRIRSNPVAQVRKPPAPRQRAVQPQPPAKIEDLRDHVGPVDAVLFTVLGYCGLRPEEALALEFRHVRKDTILIEQKNVDGQIIIGQKVLGAKARTVDMLTAVREDLRAHRMSLPGTRSTDDQLLFARPDGTPWRAHDYRNWRRRVFQPASDAAGLGTLTHTITSTVVDGKVKKHKSTTYDGMVPYDLRHSFASLLIHEGRLSVAEIADQMGHSTLMLLSTYTHLFAELKNQPKVSADVQIAKARARRVKRTA